MVILKRQIGWSSCWV